MHVEKINGVDERQINRDLNDRFHSRTEIHPNKILFHDAEEMRRLQGVGVQIKEQKIVDHRPRAADAPVAQPTSYEH